MIEIDGSYGEGGGQIVRTAVALSAVTGNPVRIKNIRRDRPKPGLAPQHAAAIDALAKISGARTAGVLPGSSEVSFEPREIRGGRYEIDIGTAGSITLLMQCLLPAMTRADGRISLDVRGGTDVRWSPTIDYFKEVFLPAAAAFGVSATIDVLHRGYYPRGGGQAVLVVEPAPLRPARIEAVPSRAVMGISHCAGLPEHVATRQASSAAEALKAEGFEPSVQIDVQRGQSIGSGITLWSGSKGGSALGARGVKAEDVGRSASLELLPEVLSSAAVDVRLGDQLIPYLALAGGSYTVREVTLHARTNIWTAAQFIEREIRIGEDGLFSIEA